MYATQQRARSKFKQRLGVSSVISRILEKHSVTLYLVLPLNKTHKPAGRKGFLALDRVYIRPLAWGVCAVLVFPGTQARHGFLGRYRPGASVEQRVVSATRRVLLPASVACAQASALRIGAAAPPRRQAPLQGANAHALQEDLDANWGG